MKNFLTIIRFISIALSLTPTAPPLYGSLLEMYKLNEEPEKTAFFAPSETEVLKENGINFPPIHQPEKITEYLNIPVDQNYIKRYKYAVQNFKDLTHIPFITIDCATTKDRDDAIAVKNNDDNSCTVYVAVSHVPHFVDQFSSLDLEAFEKAETNYEDYNPMFPEQLSTNICSLHPGVKRVALVYEMSVDENGKLEMKSITEGIIQSRSAQYYGRIDTFLKKKKYPYLQDLHKAASLLYLNRLREMPEKTRPHHLKDIDYFRKANFETVHKYGSLKGFGTIDAFCWSEKIICEFMLAANKFSAEFISEKYKMGMYRAHFMGNKVEGGHAYYTNQKDRYHEALGMNAYSHSTSPIRRYPDVVLQRLIIDGLKGKLSSYKNIQLGFIAGHCTAVQHKYYEKIDMEDRTNLSGLETISDLPSFYREIVEPNQPILIKNDAEGCSESQKFLTKRKRSFSTPLSLPSKMLFSLLERQTSRVKAELTAKIIDNEIYTVEELEKFGLSSPWIPYFIRNGHGTKKFQALNISKRVIDTLLKKKSSKKPKIRNIKYGNTSKLKIFEAVYHFDPFWGNK